MSKVEFLFLSEEDLVEAGVLDAKKCVDTIEEVFHLLGQKDYIMGALEKTVTAVSYGSQKKNVLKICQLQVQTVALCQ